MASLVRSPFTLRQTCLLKLGIWLWESIDIIPYNSPHAGVLPHFSLVTAEQDAQFKADHFCLPATLREDLQGVITTVGAQIKWWLAFHRSQGQNISVLVNRYVWTSRGRLDKEKTIRAVLKDLEPRDAFTLACLHCLEPELTSLWEQLPPEDRHFDLQNALTIYWRNRLENNHPFIYERIPYIRIDNELATHYMFLQSSRELKISILKELMDGLLKWFAQKDSLDLRGQIAEVFHRLFEEIGAEDRNNFLSDYKPTQLLYFIQWFYPEEFFDLLERWSLTEQQVQEITYVVWKGHQHCCLYQPLLDRLFEKYPSTNSRYIRDGA